MSSIMVLKQKLFYYIHYKDWYSSSCCSGFYLNITKSPLFLQRSVSGMSMRHTALSAPGSKVYLADWFSCFSWEVHVFPCLPIQLFPPASGHTLTLQNKSKFKQLILTISQLFQYNDVWQCMTTCDGTSCLTSVWPWHMPGPHVSTEHWQIPSWNRSDSPMC